jgi:hypothetical protein
MLFPDKESTEEKPVHIRFRRRAEKIHILKYTGGIVR